MPHNQVLLSGPDVAENVAADAKNVRIVPAVLSTVTDRNSVCGRLVPSISIAKSYDVSEAMTRIVFPLKVPGDTAPITATELNPY